jgi:homogentisate 1,2-dioxygenase
MPYYVRRGQVPPKRHIQFRENGHLYAEELVSTEGFSDLYSSDISCASPHDSKSHLRKDAGPASKGGY